MNFYAVQAQPFTLYGAGASIGDTSIVISSFLDITGTQLTMTSFGSKGYLTSEPGSSTNEEQVFFTGITANTNGTSTLTGIHSVGFIQPYVETSGISKSHAGGTTIVISNTGGFYSQFAVKSNDETITGQWTFTTFPITPSNTPATTTTLGIVKMSVAPVSSLSPIAVGDNDVRVPTANPTTLFAPITTKYNPIASDISDGSVTISVNTSLTRDMYYNALVVNTGVTLTTAGYRIFARTVTINGTGKIDNSGTAGTSASAGNGGAGGTAQSAGTLPAGHSGQTGGNRSNGAASPGTAGTNSTFNIVNAAGALGGNGGAGSVGSAGTGGSAGTNTSTINAPRNAVSAFYLFDFTSATAVARYNINSGSGSGAGGGEGNGGLGGGGGGGSGASGGIVWICAETITNNGTISSLGGNGGAGESTAQTGSGGGGGGGGGNGGAVILIYSTFVNSGSILVTAGTGGALGTGQLNNGTAGANGTDGIILQLTA